MGLVIPSGPRLRAQGGSRRFASFVVPLRSGPTAPTFGHANHKNHSGAHTSWRSPPSARRSFWRPRPHPLPSSPRAPSSIRRRTRHSQARPETQATNGPPERSTQPTTTREQHGSRLTRSEELREGKKI